MTVIGSNALAGASGQGGGGGYEIARSLRFDPGGSSHLDRVPSSAGNRKTWSLSCWAKTSGFDPATTYSIYGAQEDADYRDFIGFEDNQVRMQFRINGNFKIVETVAKLRDPSAWSHYLFVWDTTESTDSDRAKIYINGERQAVTTAGFSYPALNDESTINNNKFQYVGANRITSSATNFYDGYLADVHFLDGIAASPSDLGETDSSGIWQPKAYSGSYGTNGFHLKFADNSSNAALGTDSSGNSNTWTVNNLSVASGAGNDSLVDTPEQRTGQTDSGAGGEVVGNYATLNPLDSNISSNLTNGNLDAAGTSNWSAGHARGTFSLTSGKWYWEVTKTGGGATAQIGFCNKAFSLTTSYGSLPADSWTFNFGNGTEILRPSGGGGGYFSGSAMANGDVAGIALDMDAGTAVFYKNGTAGASISLSSTKTGSTNNITELFPLVGVYDASVSFNGGQRPFTHAAPSGFKALNTANLPDPTIADGSQYFDSTIYTGNGAARSISGLSFQPDLVWIKQRSGTQWHYLIDSVRGNTKALFSNATNSDFTTSAQVLTAFNNDGFSLGTDTAVNANSSTYAAWTWDGGSSTVTNSDGSISSQVRANPSAGFSIVNYTGTGATASFGHGLNAAPELVIIKGRDFADSWHVYHKDVFPKYLRLNTTDGEVTNTAVYPSVPTSSVVNIGSDGGVNTNTKNIVAYCFAPVAGYSAMGSYTGNGSADGPFVYTGFRPRWLMVKKTTEAKDWVVWDTSRSSYNLATDALRLNLSNAELNGFDIDVLSNGFKLRDSESTLNTSGTYVYAAFAENPFSLARAR